MTTQTEKNRLRKAAWRAANPGTYLADERPFAGVDGEGGTGPDGKHDYFMLRAGPRSLTTGFKHLTTESILEFLTSLPDKYIWVSYFFDYDVCKILADAPLYKLHRLMNRGERTGRKGQVFPVDLFDGKYEIEYLPGKEFKVRRILDGKKGPYTTISDVGSFFQCAFIKALDTWQIGTPEQREAIAYGKNQRNLFTAAAIPEIDKYNLLECQKLAELMEDFRSACKRSGYVPRKWQGPGQMAETMMRVRGIPARKDIPVFTDPAYEGLLEFANNSFYGGRPEITVLGPVAPAWQYDINSAYPWALLHVPCLVHGTWKKQQGWSNGQLGISFGSFCRGTGGGEMAKLYGLPVRRDNGTIFYPGDGKGWYWTFEIEAAKHQVFFPEETWVYESHCSCVPFDFIRDVYAMRLRLGKDTLGIVLKLALNSLYGKMAQSIGNPKYANPIWASFITAFCRTQVQYIIHSGPGHKRGRCGEEIVMVATDAVFSSVDLHIPDEKALGGFSVKYIPDGIFLIQPGMYYWLNQEEHPKTRGVPRVRMEELRSDFFQAYWEMTAPGLNMRDLLLDGSRSHGEPRGWASVTIPLRSFVGIRLGLHRKDPDLMGEWVGCDCLRSADHTPDCVPWEKKISFDCTNKRRPGPPKSQGGQIPTFPYPGDPNKATIPYSKEIGRWRDTLRLEDGFYEQPDWATLIYEGTPAE